MILGAGRACWPGETGRRGLAAGGCYWLRNGQWHGSAEQFEGSVLDGVGVVSFSIFCPAKVMVCRSRVARWAVEPLIAALRSGDSAVRKAAVSVFGHPATRGRWSR